MTRGLLFLLYIKIPATQQQNMCDSCCGTACCIVHDVTIELYKGLVAPSAISPFLLNQSAGVKLSYAKANFCHASMSCGKIADCTQSIVICVSVL